MSSSEDHRSLSHDLARTGTSKSVDSKTTRMVKGAMERRPSKAEFGVVESVFPENKKQCLLNR
jgi:hypothetical protein